MRQVVFVFVLSILAPGMAAAGPDVVVNEVGGATEFGRKGSPVQVGLSASTDSCNLGDTALEWRPLPSAQHPAITVNLYRVADGAFVQLARSWVKHGFYATNETDCSDVPGAPDACQRPPNFSGQKLYPGCTDLYPAGLNANPSFLGPRSKIQPTTGGFDGQTALDLTGYPESDDLDKILLVDDADLRTQNATFYVEAQYITADDAAAGNAANNVTYARVAPTLTGGLWVLPRVPQSQVRLEPAITGWASNGAMITTVKSAEELGRESTILVGSRANTTANGRHRYTYAVYNMNSDLGVRSLTIPAAGVDVASVGFHAPRANGEIWSNDAWSVSRDGSGITWSTKTHSQEPNANAIRWGSAYTFWFESDRPPGNGTAKIGRFKPTTGIPSTGASFEVQVQAPQ